MPTLVQEAGSAPVLQFTPPYKGTWNSVAVNEIAADALYDSHNIFIRKGKVRSRPGLTALNNTTFDFPIIGGKMAVTPASKVLLAISRNALHTLTETDLAWQTDTVIPFADSDEELIDITFLETSSQYVAIIANSNYVLKRWISGSGAAPITATVGSIPLARSVCTVAGRIIALIDPHTIRWSSNLDYTSWPALAVNRVAQTNDAGICVRSLSSLDFVLYKERSIYLVRSQAGSDSSAFNFSAPIIVEGPAGLGAVVDVEGLHMYMTRNGRIGIFNGVSSVQWVADGIWLHLQEHIDPQYSSKIFGVYDYRLHTATFYYPQIGSEGLLTGMVLINLPLQGSGIEIPANAGQYAATAFLGVSERACSYGYEIRFNRQIDRSLLFTTEVGNNQSCLLDELSTTDNGRAFSCAFQTGMLPLPDLKHYQLNIESYLERADRNGEVKIYAVSSDILESETGTINSEFQVIDLNGNPINEYIGFNIPCKFFGLRYEWESDESTVKYNGATVYGRIVS